MKLTFTSPYNDNTASIYAHLEQTDQDDSGVKEYTAYIPTTSWYRAKKKMCGIRKCDCVNYWGLIVSEPDYSNFDYNWHRNFKFTGTDSKYPGRVTLKIW